MTGKEKGETLKQDMAGKKKHTAKQAGKSLPETEDQKNHKVLEELKASEDKVKGIAG